MSPVGLKEFRVDSKSDALLSYCIYDPEGREAIFVDPHIDAIDEYVEFISSNRLKPILVVETQLHWSHPSGSRNLRSRYGCPIGGVDRELRDQEILSVGRFKFQVLLTPGVSRDALVLYGEKLLLSGNTLWVGTCAPGGFPDSNSKEHFQSLKKIAALKSDQGDILILPAQDSNDLIFSTLCVELRKNLALQKLSSEEDFSRWSEQRVIVPGDSFKKIYEANAKDADFSERSLRLESVFKAAGKLPEENRDFNSPIGAISPEKYASKLKEHASSNAFLDVRERDEYFAGHIAGTENFPWIEVGFHLDELRAKKRIYVSCLSGRRSSWVSRTLSYLGFNDVVNVSGGISAWQNSGLPVEKGSK